jgi:putative hemolysin
MGRCWDRSPGYQTRQPCHRLLTLPSCSRKPFALVTEHADCPFPRGTWTGQPRHHKRGPVAFRELAQPFLPMERVRELYRRAQQPADRSLFENVLAEMKVEYQVSAPDRSRIPPVGPVVVTANHPFGLLDGAILGTLLMRVRPDVKILTNSLLSRIPELHAYCIFVDVCGGSQAAGMNRSALRRAIFWLRTGGMLAVFPAGDVSHVHLRQMEIADSTWDPAVASLIRLTGAQALPVFFEGCNSAPFHAMSRLRPSLRTAWLLNEFLGQAGKKVEVRIGSTISASAVRHASTEQEAANYLRWRTYLLAQRGQTRLKVTPALPSVFARRKSAAIAPAVPLGDLLPEFEKFRSEQCLEPTGEFAVFFAEASSIPHCMRELGRLPEATFRAAGKGTGKASDLDRFDSDYKHVRLWSKLNQELVGAYRLGLTTEILPRRGVAGLYTSTLFRYDPRVFERSGPALELGRSFLRPEYQRQYAPLLMLWKGIGRYLAAHPQLAVLFGAVSISSRYNRVSRELIVRFFQARETDPELAALIRPRCPFQSSWIRPGDSPAACAQLKDLQDLADPIADLESDGKGIPILLKQYAKLGGRLVCFNVDRNFSDVLDGLVLVDLRRTDRTALERYMGKDGGEGFQRYHGLHVPAGVA